MKKLRFMSVMIMALLLSALMANADTSSNTYLAATSYTNAKEFYNSTDSSKAYHAEMVNGSIYYATRGKLAKSSTNLRYSTVGFDITMSTSECSVSFQVQRNESLYLKEVDSRPDDTYAYNLYMIDEKNLYKLAELVSDKATVEKLMSSASIDVRIDAINATRRGDKYYGSVKENGAGTLDESGTLYHLKNEDEWEALKDIFSGHDFKSYREIEGKLVNYSLTIDYNVVGTKDDNIGCTSTVSAGNGYAVSKDYLYYNGKEVLDTYRILQQFYLPDVTKKGIDLKKLGYHLPTDEEWKTPDGRIFSDSELLMPKDIEPEVGFKNKFVIMYANWQPNTYTIVYNANGGTGTVTSTTLKYDESGTLANNTFTRAGYYIDENEAWMDEEGNTYPNGVKVLNWTSIDGDKIVLKANWKPLVVQITADQRKGTDGTEYFFEKYSIGFSTDKAFTSLIDKILVPKKTGYKFLGYFESIHGVGNPLVGNDGNILTAPDYFDKDTTIYAKYEALPFKITFDKQGGYAGSNEVTAAYGDILPTADAPIRTGYSFKGYYTEPSGKGELYYNEYMAAERVYDKLEDMTLYAHWVDDSVPDVYLSPSISDWTNREVILTATAMDYGTGLSSLKLYQGEKLVAELTDLSGSMSAKLEFTNEVEGVVNYTAIATDMSGNTAEAYATAKYDITAPSGDVIEFIANEDGSISIIVDVTDIKTEQ